MNRFGEIADELTELIEELDHPDLAGEAAGLKAALERACAKACEAERRLRLKQEAEPKPAARSGHIRSPAGGRAGFGQVIELSLAWRPPHEAPRRLND